MNFVYFTQNVNQTSNICAASGMYNEKQWHLDKLSATGNKTAKPLDVKHLMIK